MVTSIVTLIIGCAIFAVAISLQIPIKPFRLRIPGALYVPLIRHVFPVRVKGPSYASTRNN